MSRGMLLVPVMGLFALAVTGIPAQAQFGGSSGRGGSSVGGSSGGFRPPTGTSTLSRGTSNRNVMDPFGATRGSPLLSSGGGYGQFGGGSFSGGGFGDRGSSSRQFGSMGGSSSMNMSRPVRLPSYAFRVVAVPPAVARAQTRLEELISTDAGPSEIRKIRLKLEGTTLVLGGTVTSESERQLAESMARLEPGVYDIRNELVVTAEQSPPPVMPPTRKRPE